MSIRISIYDFFAYTIPGSVYLFIIVYTCSQFGILHIDLLNFDPSFFQIIMMAGIAYIVGMIFEPIVKVWYRLFKPKNFPEKVLKEFQENRPHIDVKFHAIDWPILLAYIRRENMELAEYIERDNAYNLMLRSLSLGSFIFALVQIIQFALTVSFLHIVLGIVFILASIISIKFSLNFATWFYLLIYEITTARTLPGLDKVVLVNQTESQGSESDGG